MVDMIDADDWPQFIRTAAVNTTFLRHWYINLDPTHGDNEVLMCHFENTISSFRVRTIEQSNKQASPAQHHHLTPTNFLESHSSSSEYGASDRVGLAHGERDVCFVVGQAHGCIYERKPQAQRSCEEGMGDGETGKNMCSPVPRYRIHEAHIHICIHVYACL